MVWIEFFDSFIYKSLGIEFGKFMRASSGFGIINEK